MKDQTTDLSAKLVLIEAAVKAGFANNAKAIDLVKDAIGSLQGSLEEKLAAVEKAVKDQTMDLSAKLVLIEGTVKAGLVDNAKAIGLVKDAIGSLQGSLEEKLAAVEKAVKDQTTDLSAKLVLIEGTVKAGFADNAKAIDLVKDAIGSLQGSLEEKLAAVEKAVKDQTMDLSAKLALIEGAVDSGLVGDDSTLGLVRKAIEALNATAGTANDKLDAIEDAIGSGPSGLTTKMEAIREALAQGLINITEKQDLILTALNSASTYYFTKDELLEVGDDYLYVDAAFWNANHENYEVVRALKDLIPLSLPHRYKFYWEQASGKYAFSDSETTSFYGPLWSKDGIMYAILGTSELILAIDIQPGYTAPWYTSIDGHICYYMKKVYKSAYYNFRVQIGSRAAGKNIKMKEPLGKRDTFRIASDEIYLEHWTEAIKASTGVWGFSGLKYNPYSYPDNSVQFIIVEDN